MRGERAAIASATAAINHNSRRQGESAAEPATSMISAGPNNRAGSLEMPLLADATATTTMHLSPRRVASRGMQLSVTVSIGRKE
jgi:hypothetical protein